MLREIRDEFRIANVRMRPDRLVCDGLGDIAFREKYPRMFENAAPPECLKRRGVENGRQGADFLWGGLVGEVGLEPTSDPVFKTGASADSATRPS